MSIQQRPVSELIRGTDFADDEPKKRSREDFKKEKELEELRKAGTVPALVDEDGKDINPHIPQYISTTPWYYGSSGPTLKHQRPQDDKTGKIASVNEWYPRGTTNKKAAKFRPGACENCGAMGHNKKSCFERPRKVPAKVSGIVIAPDDNQLPDLNLDYDSKRDRWNGYDPKMYKAVVEEFNKLEEAKKILKEEKAKEETGDAKTESHSEKADSDADSDSDEEDKCADHIDMPGTKVDSKQRITVRNLRIREDTAKYLRNLDPDSAYYDPKTRSMRDNPYKNTSDDPSDLPYAGENYVRYSGDTVKVGQIQLFAWQARDKGADIHLQAEPTKAEIIHKEFQHQKTKLKTSIKQSILAKYGGEEHLKSPPRELIYGQSERYIEYSRDGKPKIEPPKTIIRSKYEEDVYLNNHTSVWGSYYNVKTQKWGYKCCHATVKNAYCVGSAGICSDDLIRENLLHDIEKMKKKKESSKQSEPSSSSSKEAEKSPENESKIIVSKERWSELGHKKRKRGNNLFAAEEEENMDERKRPYNSMTTTSFEPTEKEIEEYRRKKDCEDDPMFKYMRK